MNRENKDLSESHAETSAVEAALGQLRPRREARFADDVKSQIKDALSGNTSATVKIPLTHYIRIAQFNAAVGGLLAGLLLGVLLGGSGVFFAVKRFETERSQSMQSSYAMRSPYVQMLLNSDTSLTSLERALLDKLDKEPSHGRR